MKSANEESNERGSEPHGPVGSTGLGRRRPMRWRKGARYSGRMRLPETHELRCGGELLAIAQCKKNGQWFWYGFGQNTSHRPDTLENVKAEATDVARQKTPTDKVSHGAKTL